MEKKKIIIIGVVVLVLIIGVILLLPRNKVDNSVIASVDYVGKDTGKGTLINVDPLLDENGMANSKFFDFKVNFENEKNNIYYEVIIAPKSTNTVDVSHLKTYLTNQSNIPITGVVPYNELINSENGKIIYRGLANSNSAKTKDFRLRMWLSSEYQQSGSFDFDISLNSRVVENGFTIDGSAALSLKSVTGNVLTNEQIITDIYAEGDGPINCKSSDETIAICEVVDKKLTINALTVGEATIEVTQSAGSLYLKPSTVQFSVKVASSKVPATLTLEEESGTAFLEMIKEVDITTTGDGTLSCKSSDESVATCMIDNKTLKINGVSKGNTTITVSQDEGNTTLAPSDVTFTVTNVLAPAAVTINEMPELNKVAYGKVYSGKNPDNYVWFNNEQWRIIGTYGDSIKIIRDVPYTANQVYNSSSGNTWEGSTLQNYLYDNYDSIISDETSRKMVLNDATWYVGATVPQIVASSAYLDSAKNEWKGKIGLISSYEYQYGASKSCWLKKANTYKTNCGDDDWLFSVLTSGEGNNGSWMITPSTKKNRVLHVNSKKNIDDIEVQSTSVNVSPVVYLKKAVGIISGSGKKGEADSYKLGF